MGGPPGRWICETGACNRMVSPDLPGRPAPRIRRSVSNDRIPPFPHAFPTGHPSLSRLFRPPETIQTPTARSSPANRVKTTAQRVDSAKIIVFPTNSKKISDEYPSETMNGICSKNRNLGHIPSVLDQKSPFSAKIAQSAVSSGIERLRAPFLFF